MRNSRSGTGWWEDATSGSIATSWARARVASSVAVIRPSSIRTTRWVPPGARAGAHDPTQLRVEGGEEGLLALGERGPEAPEVTLEVTLGEEQGERPLLDRAGTAVGGLELRHERLHGGRRDDRIAGPEPRVEHLAEGADIEDPAVGVEALEGGQRMALVAHLAVAVVLDDDRPVVGRPLEELEPASDRHRARPRGYCHDGVTSTPETSFGSRSTRSPRSSTGTWASGIASPANVRWRCGLPGSSTASLPAAAQP